MAIDALPPLLLVEDDERYARGCRRALTQHGLQVCWVRSAAEARTVLALDSLPYFEYALVDDRLPDGFGLELMPQLQALMPRPATALLTAYPSYHRALAAYREGYVLFPKPETPRKLVDLLCALDRQQGWLRARR